MERNFKEACVIVLTETCLNENVPDAKVNLDNFTVLRADHPRESGKKRGGGFLGKTLTYVSALMDRLLP